MNVKNCVIVFLLFLAVFSNCGIANAQQDNRTTFSHTVGRGETLMSIARMYNVSVKEILDLNGRKDEKIYAGETLLVPNKRNKFHTIQPGETLYRLSTVYGVSVDEICDLNPGLSVSTFKAGMVIRIPFKDNSDNENIEKDFANGSLAENNNCETNYGETGRADSFIKEADGVFDVALILPFTINGKEKSRITEFYEGLLIGVYDMKQRGLSINLNVYDTNVRSIQSIVADNSLKSMDLIIGPFSVDNIGPLSDFSKKNRIHLVIPFTSKADDVFDNPYIFQINTPQSYLYSEVYAKFIDKFRNYNIVFIDDASNNDKKSFIEGLKHELSASNISYKTTQISSLHENSLNLVSAELPTIFIPNSGKSTQLSVILPSLQNIRQAKPEVEFHLFGYPEWQTYTHDYLSAFYEVDTYFYSSFYANNLSSISSVFYNKYKKWYHKEMINTYPKYGMLGYDLFSYFSMYWKEYKGEFDKKLNTLVYDPVQTGFKFERVNNWGGFINKKIFFIHMSKDSSLNKIDFD